MNKYESYQKTIVNKRIIFLFVTEWTKSYLLKTFSISLFFQGRIILAVVIKYDLLGEAPIQTQATAQKCRETPMGRTGTVE